MKTIIGTAVAASCLIAGLICGSALSAGASDQSNVPAASKIWPSTNDSGDTFGLMPDNWTRLQELPDLISAIADDGTEGYVRRDAVFPDPTTLTPGQVVDSTGAKIPVYAQDGTTVIGTLTLTGSTEQK